MEKKLNKKWIIILAVLVLIGVSTTLILVFLPKNIGETINRSYAFEETMFLTDKEDEDNFNELKNLLEANESYQARDVVAINEMLSSALRFYNKHMVFVKNSSSFQGEYRNIMDGFARAENAKNDMSDKLLEAHFKLEEGAISFIPGAWREFKDLFYQYIDGFSQALRGLNKTLTAGLDGVTNNKLTAKVLDTFDDYMMVIRDSKFDELTNTNASSGVIGFAKRFANNYIVNDNMIVNYNFNETVQARVDTMLEFENVYGASVQEVIESIEGSRITFKKEVSDPNGSFEILETFLQGGQSL